MKYICATCKFGSSDSIPFRCSFCHEEAGEPTKPYSMEAWLKDLATPGATGVQVYMLAE